VLQNEQFIFTGMCRGAQISVEKLQGVKYTCSYKQTNGKRWGNLEQG
jgi:hypothetical protein